MAEVIEKKRALSEEKTPKYGTRKLSIGLVSCMLGFSLIIAPGSSKAAGETDSTEKVETVVSDKEIPEPPVETPAEEVKPAESKEEAQPAETTEEKTVENTKAEPVKEEVAEVKEEFKLTDAQIQRLKDADFTDAEISVVEENIKAYVEENKDFDVDGHIADVIKTKEANEKRETEENKKVEDQNRAANDNEAKDENSSKDETSLEIAPVKEQEAVKDAAAPEDTSTSADAKNAVHGFVGVLVGGDINADLAAETGQRFKPIEGVKVYFQWYEKTGNRTSPTYYAVSGADGQFHIKVKSYIGQDGKLVNFDADTTSSAGSESYKMWVDESTIPEGYQLQYSTGEGVEFTDRRVAGGGYQLGPNRLVNYRVLLMEKQDEEKMHKKATPTGPQIAKTGQGAVWGKVSWDYESAGGVQWGIVSTPTSPAEGVTVTASYLSDYALKKIYSADTANMLGLSKPSDIRGSGWTFKLETQLQEWIAKQVAADKDKWIAETVSAKTNAEGDYLIQFKGTWGPHRNTSAVAEYERVAGKYYAGDAHRWTEEEVNRLGTVAKNAEDGGFLTGALDWNEKHINSDWLFISTKDTDDVVKRTPWNYNWYTGSNNAWGIHGGWAQSSFGVSTVQAANSTRADFNLAPAEIKFNITNFDTQKNTATPGDVAVTNTAGLPHKNTSDSFKIVWYDQDGNKIKEEPTQKPTSTGALAEATYDTTGVTETKTFIAKLHYVDSKGNLGQVLAQDAFTVKISKLVVSAYDEVSIENPSANDDSMKGATYSAEGLPEGLTIDEKTGTISGKAKVPGKYNVTVTTSILDEESGETMEGTANYTALVTDSPLEHGEVGVEYKGTVKPAEVEGYVFKKVSAKFIDGKAIDGLNITDDKISGTPKAEVAATQEDPNVEVTYDIYKLNSNGDEVLIKKGHKDLVPLEITKAASQAPKYEPAYTDVEGTPGTEVTTEAPKFLDQKSEADPKPEAKPQPKDVEFALGDGAPQGATIDEKTGKVTYTPTARDANTTVDIPVKVTYSDGTIDETLAKIKVGQAQADSYQPEYTEADAKAGTQTTITAPNFTDKDGQPAAKPEGAKFTLGKDAPTDATINEDTGEITYKPSIDQAGQTVNIPVIVTYKDGSTDEVKAPVKVAEADNLNYEPDYKSVVAQVAHPVKVEAPKFLDKENKEASPQPTGMTFAIEDGFTTNGTLTIDDKTGAITYTAVDADKDTVIEVPVIVTYADGSKESVKAKIDVPSDANFYDPKAKPLTTEQGIVPNAEDGVVIDNNPPAETTYTWEAVPKVNTPGETTGTVKVTYPDGTEDFVEVPVTVIKSESNVTKVDDSNKKSVDPTDQKQGTGIVVTNPDDTTKVSATDVNGKSVPVVINEENGQIEVTPGTDAKGPITVTVTDDDFPTGKTFEVPVKEKSATPVITEPKAGDKTISGTGIAGSKIDLAIEGGEGSEDTPIGKNVVVGEDGTWTANVPDGVNLNAYDIILATQTEDGKSVSDEARVVVKALTDAEKNNPEAVANPIETEVGKVPEAKNGIANIGELDNVEEVVWLTEPDVSKVADNVKGTALVVYKDGSTDKVEVPIKVVDKTAPEIDRIGDQTVVEGKPIADVTVTTDDPNAKITIEGQPDGVTVTEGKISGTPKVSDWGEDEEKDFTVKVTAEDEAGNSETTEFTIKVQRDTDGDGIPDVKDDDDDGDGIPDKDDKNSKVADKLSATLDPATQEVIEGKAIKGIVVTPNKKDAKVSAEGLPAGLELDPRNNTIVGTPTIEDWGDEEEKELTVKATVTREGENPVEVTATIKVQRDTDGDGIPDVKDDDDDNDGIPDKDDKNPKVADKTTLTVTPETQTKVEGKTGTEIEPIKAESNKPGAKITTDNPNLTVGEDGQITGTLPKIKDWGEKEEERTVEVKVTSTVEGEDPIEKTVKIVVKRDTDGDGIPDVKDDDDDNDGIPDKEDKNSKEADKLSATLDPETQEVVEGKAIKGIVVTPNKEGATIDATGLPAGLELDTRNNTIVGTPEITDWKKADAEAGTEAEEERDIEVKVTVKRDGEEDVTLTATIKVLRDTDKDGIPDKTDDDDDGDGVSDEDEKKAGTDPKDKDSKPADKDTTAPKIDRIGDQTVVEKQPIKEIEVKIDDPEAEITVDGLPNGVTYDKDTKKITGSPEIKDWNDTDKENPEEVREVSVKVTAKDKAGNESTEEFTITVQRDTDGDGTPDIYDKDDDGDGVSDEDEKKAGTDPKDKDSKPADKDTTAPKINRIGDQTVVEGKPIADVTVTTDDPNAKITIEGQPEGVSVEGNKISGTPEAKDWGKEEESRDFTVKVTAEDEAGNKSETEFTITVQRDTDGDGTPDIYDKDDDGDGVSDEEEKEAGTDPKDIDSKPETPAEEDKDTYVTGKATPVDPTDEEQGTGYVVKNPSDDTKVSAKDEDGNDVPARIDEDGNILVTPGENVDGPIEVTVEDPDLPDGSITVEVPVNGHEKDKDDNGSETPEDKKTEVTVEAKPVDPTDEPQDTGIKVENKDDDTKVSAKDEDGNDIPVEIDEDGKVIVTPGEDVDGPITVTVEDPEIPDGKVEIEVPVNGHEKDKDDNNSDKKPEDSKGEPLVVYPIETHPIFKNIGDDLTEEEIKNAIVVVGLDKGKYTVTINEGQEIPTTDKAGDYIVDLTLTYADGTTEQVQAVIIVKGEEAGKTSVDETGKKPVKPTDEKQDTGVKVTNPDKDTKVTAKDEDGKDVLAEIDENGNIVVTPGENVDGPIDVTVEDPDLPGGKVEVEVEVEGHEKGKDDNNSEKPEEKKTSVDDSNVKPVNPTDEKQGTGVKVENPDKDTKVSAKDEDGNDVPVVINPETGEVEVTPGENVDGPITVTVEDPDLPGGKVEVEVPVNGHEKGKDDNGSDKTDADKITPVVPTEKTGVKDLDKLTDKEKEEVKKKIEDANKDNFPEGTNVTVNDDGSATITYPDKSTDTIPAKDLVFQYKHGDAEEHEKPELKIADIIDPAVPGKTEVGDKNNLTDKEKEDIKNKIEESNKDNFPEGTKVEVGNDGTATITYPDGSKDTIKGSDLVSEKTQTPEEKTDAQNNPAVIPSKTIVGDKNKLTDKEKAEVIEKVKKANPKATKVVVADNGTATLTYPDGSTNTIEGSKLVVQKEVEADRKSQKVNAGKKASVNSKNVNTGVESLVGTLATLTTAIGGLFASKKKKRK